MQKDKVIGYSLAIISAAAFGLNPLFVLPIKSSSITLDITLFYRFLMGAGMIALFLLIKKENLIPRKKDIFKLLVMGLMYALSSEFLFLGYDALSAGIASTVLYTYPMMVALMLHFGFNEKVTKSTKYSMLLAFIGVSTLGWDNSGLHFNFWGIFIVLMSGLVYSIYMLIVNKGNIELSGIKTTMYSLLFSSFYFGFKSILLHHSFILPNIQWVAYVGCFSFVTTVVSVLGVVYAIHLVGSTTTAILSAFEPLVAVVVSVTLFNESMTWKLSVGMLLVLIAVTIHIYGEQHKKLSPAIISKMRDTK